MTNQIILPLIKFTKITAAVVNPNKITFAKSSSREDFIAYPKIKASAFVACMTKDIELNNFLRKFYEI